MAVKFKQDGVTVAGQGLGPGGVYNKDAVVPEDRISESFLELLRSGDEHPLAELVSDDELPKAEDAEAEEDELPEPQEHHDRDGDPIPDPDAGLTPRDEELLEGGGGEGEKDPNEVEPSTEPTPDVPPAGGEGGDPVLDSPPALVVDPAEKTVADVEEALSKEGVTQEQVDAVKAKEKADRGDNARKGIMEFELPGAEGS